MYTCLSYKYILHKLFKQYNQVICNNGRQICVEFTHHLETIKYANTRNTITNKLYIKSNE